ncbi:MAG: glutamate 5-kinase [Deltaproteobacteria bacterium]|jgi:glutamate 5-kinase|nr:glutamate 5-kinase [Deltaproteobacteria bacterium]
MTRQTLKKVRRMVVKVGSQLICGDKGLAMGRVKALAGQMAELKRVGLDCVLVTSGAVALGFSKLGLKERPGTLRLKQASAAAGQVALMTAWEKAFGAFGHKVAQILLTADDLANRVRFLNARHTMTTLLENGLVPAINENDTVAVEELKVGDNDTLGSLVASLVEADLFINLTDQDGLFDSDPQKNAKAKLIETVDKVTPDLLALAGGSGPLGTGGMFTKVRAAGHLAERGVSSLIANGQTRDILLRIIDGEALGTFFKPARHPRGAYKHWLAMAARPKGKLVVDTGAAVALKERGKSLLPGGVAGVEGLFAAGDAVSVSLSDGEPFGIGLVNYSAPEVGQIMGFGSQEIADRLGYSHSDEIIHRDNLVIFPG